MRVFIWNVHYVVWVSGEQAALNQGMHTAAIELRRKWKQAVCVVVRPGTVDTQLSKPFQGNVPEHKLFDVARAADQLLGVLDELEPEHTGLFLTGRGSLLNGDRCGQEMRKAR